MKKRILVASLLLTGIGFSQEVKDNKLAVDFNFGANKPVSHFTPGYSMKALNMFHTDLGLRYMLNSRVGFKLDAGIDNFSSKVTSYDFNSKYFRLNLQAVLNVGNILKFNHFTSKFGLLAHTGIGFSSLNAEKLGFGKGYDDMTNLIVGLTPQFKASDKLSINLDLSFIGNIYQNHTFDYKSKVNDNGIDGNLMNFSVGISYYLGKGKHHMDWAEMKPEDNSKLDSLELRLVNATQNLEKSTMTTNLNPTVTKVETVPLPTLEEQIKAVNAALLDSDKDGIADYLDLEPNTPEGAKVDKDGKEIKK